MEEKMKKKLGTVTIAIALSMILGLAGCAGGGTPQEAEPVPEPVTAQEPAPAPEPEPEPEPTIQGEILIAVAASLQNAFEKELIPLFNEQYPDVKVTGTYDGSGKLQTQIEEGLDAALFFSAATKQMDALAGSGLIDGETIVNLLGNEIVLITGTEIEAGSGSSDNDEVILHHVDDDGEITSYPYTAVTGFENITDAASIAIGDPASVPAGQYAEEILTSLGSWEEVAARASFGMNVTEVLNWVAERSAEVGIVYMTDAAVMEDRVRVIAIAPAGTLQTPVVYPVGLLANLGDREEAAAAFLKFLKSDDAAMIFTDYGFKTL